MGFNGRRGMWQLKRLTDGRTDCLAMTRSSLFAFHCTLAQAEFRRKFTRAVLNFRGLSEGKRVLGGEFYGNIQPLTPFFVSFWGCQKEIEFFAHFLFHHRKWVPESRTICAAQADRVTVRDLGGTFSDFGCLTGFCRFATILQIQKPFRCRKGFYDLYKRFYLVNLSTAGSVTICKHNLCRAIGHISGANHTAADLSHHHSGL